MIFYLRVFNRISHDSVKLRKLPLQFGPIGGTLFRFLVFENEDEPSSVVTPIWLFYFGPNVKLFESAFSHITPRGTIKNEKRYGSAVEDEALFVLVRLTVLISTKSYLFAQGVPPGCFAAKPQVNYKID